MIGIELRFRLDGVVIFFEVAPGEPGSAYDRVMGAASPAIQQESIGFLGDD
jgi:hypothetical protein